MESLSKSWKTEKHITCVQPSVRRLTHTINLFILYGPWSRYGRRCCVYESSAPSAKYRKKKNKSNYFCNFLWWWPRLGDTRGVTESELKSLPSVIYADKDAVITTDCTAASVQINKLYKKNFDFVWTRWFVSGVCWWLYGDFNNIFAVNLSGEKKSPLPWFGFPRKYRRRTKTIKLQKIDY